MIYQLSILLIITHNNPADRCNGLVFIQHRQNIVGNSLSIVLEKLKKFFKCFWSMFTRLSVAITESSGTVQFAVRFGSGCQTIRSIRFGFT